MEVVQKNRIALPINNALIHVNPNAGEITKQNKYKIKIQLINSYAYTDFEIHFNIYMFLISY